MMVQIDQLDSHQIHPGISPRFEKRDTGQAGAQGSGRVGAFETL